MLWGAFCAEGRLKIQFTSSKMNSKDYVEVLKMSLVPFFRANRRKRFIFQQDNAAIHASKHTKGWLASKKFDVLAWPACSPDLNPIENLWGILVRRVYLNGVQFESVEALKIAIAEEWDKIEPGLLQNVIESMKNRIYDLIGNKGKEVNYYFVIFVTIQLEIVIDVIDMKRVKSRFVLFEKKEKVCINLNYV